jgi:hypothetical protein
MASKSKMIAISERTYHNLAQMGTLEDTFDSVIDRMIQKQKAASGQSPLVGSPGQDAVVNRNDHRREGGQNG